MKSGANGRKIRLVKFIFVSGGVVSGLGKGITAASMGAILKAWGIEVTIVKIDMYLNVDAGTIRPQEHGEVFVTDDGVECDQDLGNYERFLNKSLRKENYMTTGQIYKTVIEKERAFGYEGEDVEAVPHVTDEIIRRIKEAGRVNKAKIVIVELGGTVGEYQNGLFFEASRILKLRQPRDVIQVHVTYLPFLKNIGELKSKPAQQSVHLLNAMGIQPDFLVGRSEKPMDQRRRERLADFCNILDRDIIEAPDLPSIYEVPEYLEKQKFAEKIIQKLHLRVKSKKANLRDWNRFNQARLSAKRKIKIAIVGKYFMTGEYKLTDSYLCVIEAIKQSAWKQGIEPVISWVDSTEFENGKISLKDFAGVIVPQDWGKRGVEGKLKAVKYVRENKIPYLGLCFGMQMAVIEFARNVLKLTGANSTEVDSTTRHPVINIMPDQATYLAKKQYGGTIRLGAWPCKVVAGSKLAKIYQKHGQGWIISERHRHRYEFNNDYRQQFETAGMVVSGTSPDGHLVEAIEISDHPFFVGTQFHPEYIARPMSPHPIFMEFVRACLK